ncbi:2925_t:CDS:2, partial [Funneliformis geosporum]
MSAIDENSQFSGEIWVDSQGYLVAKKRGAKLAETAAETEREILGLDRHKSTIEGAKELKLEIKLSEPIELDLVLQEGIHRDLTEEKASGETVVVKTANPAAKKRYEEIKKDKNTILTYRRLINVEKEEKRLENSVSRVVLKKPGEEPQFLVLVRNSKSDPLNEEKIKNDLVAERKVSAADRNYLELEELGKNEEKNGQIYHTYPDIQQIRYEAETYQVRTQAAKNL